MSILPSHDLPELEHFEHPLSSRYASKAMVRILSPLYRMRVWRRLWIALAESEKELGLPITQAQVDELRATQDTVKSACDHVKSAGDLLLALLAEEADDDDAADTVDTGDDTTDTSEAKAAIPSPEPGPPRSAAKILDAMRSLIPTA